MFLEHLFSRLSMELSTKYHSQLTSWKIPNTSQSAQQGAILSPQVNSSSLASDMKDANESGILFLLLSTIEALLASRPALTDSRACVVETQTVLSVVALHIGPKIEIVSLRLLKRFASSVQYIHNLQPPQFSQMLLQFPQLNDPSPIVQIVGVCARYRPLTIQWTLRSAGLVFLLDAMISRTSDIRLLIAQTICDMIKDSQYGVELESSLSLFLERPLGRFVSPDRLLSSFLDQENLPFEAGLTSTPRASEAMSVGLGDQQQTDDLSGIFLSLPSGLQPFPSRRRERLAVLADFLHMEAQELSQNGRVWMGGEALWDMGKLDQLFHYGLGNVTTAMEKLSMTIQMLNGLMREVGLEGVTAI